MDKNYQGNRVFSIVLKEPLNKQNYDITKIHDWYKKYEHRKIFRVCLETKNGDEEPQLFLAGWNYKDTENKIGKYPVFGEYNPKTYVVKEKAIEIEKELKDSGYNVKII